MRDLGAAWGARLCACREAASFSAPSMGVDMEVKVLPETGHSD
jgi:hypothetical protein